jgi:hypothetical protein
MLRSLGGPLSVPPAFKPIPDRTPTRRSAPARVVVTQAFDSTRFGRLCRHGSYTPSYTALDATLGARAASFTDHGTSQFFAEYIDRMAPLYAQGSTSFSISARFRITPYRCDLSHDPRMKASPASWIANNASEPSARSRYAEGPLREAHRARPPSRRTSR